MKKLIIFLLIITFIMPFSACADNDNEATTQNIQSDDLTALAEGAMTDEEFGISDVGDAIVLETCIKEKQALEDSRTIIRTGTEDGTSILCAAVCSEEDYALLVPETKVIIFGYKGEVNGQMGIIDATIEILE